jgi:hypothetical protein
MILDLSKVRARRYRSQWRFIIDCPSSFKNKSFYYTHYMGTDDTNRPSRWSRFIIQVMNTKLSKTDIKEGLPQIRETLPLRVTLADIYHFLAKHNPSLARSLFDVSVIFDTSPHDLKSYIVICFGVRADDLQGFLDAKVNAA